MKKRVLLGLSGSIAAFKTCQVISSLVKKGYEVQTVASPSALQFVGPASLEGLSGKPVLTDTFTVGHHMDHIHLMRWADLILLCPASASMLNKMASGVADTLWSTLFLAHDFNKPYLVAPAMNTSMLNHPTTKNSLARLQEWGVQVLGTDAGSLACGERGEGRLLDPERIVSAVERALEPRPRLKVLITSGGTREPIDGVRSLTNFSTGRTGAELASYFAHQGHHVTLLQSSGAEPPKTKPAETISYVTFRDLEKSLRQALSHTQFDLVLHLAAVSDYSVEAVEIEGERRPVDPELKISSRSDAIRLHLKRNPKLLPQLKSFARKPDFLLVGFKLTRTPDPEKREQAVQQIASDADLVVQNDLSEISGDRHEAVIYRSSEKIAQTQTKLDLARVLEQVALQKHGLGERA